MDSKEIKNIALKLGFDACGIAKAGLLHSHEVYFNQWLSKGSHGSMAYMERNREKRLDPRVLLPGARSVIVLAKNYFPSSGREKDFKISKYAYGRDYHLVIREKLFALLQQIEASDPAIRSRGFTDSAPVLERAWAEEAGLGWTGKNACLIIPKRGSFFFLAEVITTLELDQDEPFRKNHCGNCTRCLEACPTKAITAPGQIDARRCISYHTIESKEPIPREIREKNPGWIFGCDICQDVCPHNRFSVPHQEPAFAPLQGIGTWTKDQWLGLEKTEFRKLFVKGSSPLARAGYEKIMDNMRDT